MSRMTAIQSNARKMGVILALLLGGSVRAQNDSTSASARPAPDTLSTLAQSMPDSTASGNRSAADSVTVFRKMENKAFGVGETLIFEIAYGMIKAGTSTMSIPDTQWVNGRPCYHIVTTAETSPFFSAFFEVRDKVISLMDIDGLFTWKFEKHLREGKFRSDRYEIFDQIRQRVFAKSDTFSAPLYVQDVLSSFYYSRIVPLEVGTPIDIDNFADGIVYPLRILVHRKEKIRVPAGVFNCIVVEPVMRVEGIFKQTGKLTIWVTDDERKMPVLMKSKIFFGSIDARLKKYFFNKQ
jgi:hypothetical protein